MFKKISTKVLWIIVAALLLLACGLIIWIANSDGLLLSILIGAEIIIFIILTILIQVVSFKSFKFKAKKGMYIEKSYKANGDLFKLLEENGFKNRKQSYGSSFIKIEGKIAYKVVIVLDNNKYYNPQDEAYEPDKRLDSCDTFVAFEIFNDISDNKDKLADYSIQANNVYYTAFGLENDSYKCFNYIEPSEKYLAPYNKLMKILCFEEIKIEENK